MPTPFVAPHHINLWCLKDVLGPHDIVCGCPTCCAAIGCTEIFCVEDFEPGVRPLGYWPKSVCSEKLALLCKERIVPGWPGGGKNEQSPGERS